MAQTMLLPSIKTLASLPVPAGPVLWARGRVEKEIAKAPPEQTAQVLATQREDWAHRDVRFWSNVANWTPTVGLGTTLGSVALAGISTANSTMTLGENILTMAYGFFGHLTLDTVASHYYKLSIQRAVQAAMARGPLVLEMPSSAEDLGNSIQDMLQLIVDAKQKISFPTKRVALALGAAYAFYDDLPPLGHTIKALYDDEAKAAMVARTEILNNTDVCVVASDGASAAILACSGDDFVMTFPDRDVVSDTLMYNFDRGDNLLITSRYLMLANNPETVDSLLKIATSADAEKSEAALSTLVGMGSTEAVFELTDFLENHEYGNDVDLQLRVATALIAFGTEESFGAVLQNLMETGIIVPLIVPDAAEAAAKPEVIYY